MRSSWRYHRSILYLFLEENPTVLMLSSVVIASPERRLVRLEATSTTSVYCLRPTTVVLGLWLDLTIPSSPLFPDHPTHDIQWAETAVHNSKQNLKIYELKLQTTPQSILLVNPLGVSTTKREPNLLTVNSPLSTRWQDEHYIWLFRILICLRDMSLITLLWQGAKGLVPRWTRDLVPLLKAL